MISLLKVFSGENPTDAGSSGEKSCRGAQEVKGTLGEVLHSPEFCGSGREGGEEGDTAAVSGAGRWQGEIRIDRFGRGAVVCILMLRALAHHPHQLQLWGGVSVGECLNHQARSANRPADTGISGLFHFHDRGAVHVATQISGRRSNPSHHSGPSLGQGFDARVHECGRLPADP